MKLNGIKTALHDYHFANRMGRKSSRYGVIMIDLNDGEVWTDVFYDKDRSLWIDYKKKSVVCLSKIMKSKGIYKINKKNIQNFINDNYGGR